MGFPLSRFQQLSSLCKEEKYTVEEFAKYRLTAIVLHKPKSRTFKNVMQNNFEYLHSATGMDFAFITFLDPPESWAESHRSWMSTREALVTDSGKYSSEDFMKALCSRLSITELPAIVLTDNLNSPTYAVLSTDASSIVSQLEEIGRYASAQPKRFPVSSKPFLDFLDEIGRRKLLSTIDSEYLSTNIADIMAAFSMDGSGASDTGNYSINRMAENSQKESAKKHIREAISRNKRRYDTVRDEHEPNTEKIDTACDVYTSYLALVLKQETESRNIRRFHHIFRHRETSLTNSINDSVMIGEPELSFSCYTQEPWFNDVYPTTDQHPYTKYFTENSKIFYETFQLLYQLWKGEIHSEYVNVSARIDYSPMCVELCKIVEEELNASVVQLIRQHMGIPMPEFYREHCGKKGKVVVANNLINLLDKRTKKLKQIPIGSILCMLQSLNNAKDLTPFNTDKFITSVTDFKDIRNDTPHSIVLTEEDFNEMNRMFDDLCNEWMKRLYEVKQDLQGYKRID